MGSVYVVWGIIALLGVITLISKNRGNCSFALWRCVSFILFNRWFSVIDLEGVPPYYSYIFREFAKVVDYEDILDDSDGGTID